MPACSLHVNSTPPSLHLLSSAASNCGPKPSTNALAHCTVHLGSRNMLDEFKRLGEPHDHTAVSLTQTVLDNSHLSVHQTKKGPAREL